LHSGSPKVAQYFRDNIYLIKTLAEFQHIDDNGRDVGADVRVRARELSRLLTDDNHLAETRRRRKQMRDRMAGKRISESNDETSEAPRRAQQPKKPSREEQEIQRALQLSKQDEAERRRRLAEQAKEGLFDDPKPAPSNLIDLSIDESQPGLLQPQFTSFPPQMTTASYAAYDPSTVQAQFTAFDPSAQQAQYEAMLQAAYAQQQADVAEQQRQYYALQLQAAQFQAAQLQASQQPSLVPQKTAFGSNNPFASDNFFAQPTPSPVPTPQLPQYTPPIPSARSTPALVQGRPLSGASVSSGASSLPPRTPVSTRADALSAVLASAGPGGVDTFGNIGSLRYGGSAYGRAAQRGSRSAAP